MPDPDSTRTVSPRPAEGTSPVSGDAPTVRPAGQHAADENASSFRRRLAALPMPVPGDRIDVYELEADLGAGGMGAVFRARDGRLDRLVALKVLPPDQAVDPDVVQRFYQEARAAARLDHENIARVYTIGHDRNYHFIAFEYIEGTSIRERVADGTPLGVAEAVNYTLQIAAALVHANERQVVHRDIKPSNIVVTPQGRAKLVDMGLARRFERGQDDGLTQPGTTLGTFDYISPEQARDPRDVDVRSDLYSLGCTMFHMLAGRPPFPEGTVAQKLLLHQKEPAPDLRGLNPDVPAELAAMVTRLMAKDRERRHQTPEALVRDLLTVAGTLGLRSVSPEGLVWLPAPPRPAWERHLVWAVPAAAFAVVIGLLLFSNRAEEITSIPGESQPLVGTDLAQKPDAGAESPVNKAPETPATAVPTRSPARTVAVRSGEDLGRILATAPSGSTIVLSEPGPFDVRPDARLDPPAARDLVLTAAAGVRPVVRLKPTRSAGATTGIAAVRLGPGRVTIEGIEFQLSPGGDDGRTTAITAEDTDLTVRRCLFRRTGTRGPAGDRLSAIEVLGSPDSARRTERPAPTVVVESLFDGGLVGIAARGAVDLMLRQVAFGPGDPCISIVNDDTAAPVPARIALRHVSVLAGADAPVIRLVKSAAVIRVDDSVIAPPKDGKSTLVATDEPERLDWLGRSNVYARLGPYLRTIRGAASRPGIDDFPRWAEDARSSREIDSVALDAPLWEDSDPLRSLTRNDPSAAFALTGASLPSASVGATQGPFGSIAGGPTALAAVAPTALETPPATVREPQPSPAPPVETVRPMDVGTTGGEATASIPSAPMERTDPANGGRLSPMDRPPMAAPEGSTRQKETATSVTTGEVAKPEPDREPREPQRGSTVIRTAEDLREAIRRLPATGGLVTLPSDASITLPALPPRGDGHWTIAAADPSSRRRPVLRFRPEGKPADGEATSLFTVRGGELELRGVDVVLERSLAPESGRWSAFALAPGAGIRLSQCTVTVEGNFPGAAVAVVTGRGGRTGTGAAVFRAFDCVLRSGGDIVDIPAAQRLELNLEDTLVAATGAMVHGHGGDAKTAGDGPLKLALRDVTARNAGGLIHLESAPDGPKLPAAEVEVRDSILATDGAGGPLVRIDGQDALEGLRDRVKWEGHNVAYDRIETYRRDQSAQPGTVPSRFDRMSWEQAVAPREMEPFHGAIDFEVPWDDDREPWTVVPEDARLAQSVPDSVGGADPDRLPTPPSMR